MERPTASSRMTPTTRPMMAMVFFFLFFAGSASFVAFCSWSMAQIYWELGGKAETLSGQDHH